MGHTAVLPRRLAAVAGLTVLVAVSGCTRAEPGSAVRAPGGPAADTVDLNLLSTGNLPVQPAAPLGAAGTWAKGALAESRRLADSVVGPWDVDPSFVVPGTARALVLKDAASLALIEPSPVADVARARGLVGGFASDRQNEDGWRLVNTVLRFPDPASARSAAADMTRAATAATAGTPLSIPDHPGTQAVAATANAKQGPDGPVNVYAFTPHGAYVSCQLINADAPDAATLIAQAVDTQVPRLDAFAPTDPAGFPQLPLDPTGLLAHTMAPYDWPEKDTNPTNPNIGVYSPYAALHFEDDPPSAAVAFATAGLQSMSHNAATVYQASDPAAAAKLTDDLADTILRNRSDARTVNAVDFLPGSRCVQFDRSGADSEVNVCFETVGTFALEVHNSDLIGAHHQAAAQYKMLLGWP